MRRRLRDLEHAVARARVHGLKVDRSLRPHGPEWFEQRVAITCPCCGVDTHGREVQSLILLGDTALGMVTINGQACPGCGASSSDFAELLLAEPVREPAAPMGLWVGRVRLRSAG